MKKKRSSNVIVTAAICVFILATIICPWSYRTVRPEASHDSNGLWSAARASSGETEFLWSWKIIGFDGAQQSAFSVSLIIIWAVAFVSLVSVIAIKGKNAFLPPIVLSLMAILAIITLIRSACDVDFSSIPMSPDIMTNMVASILRLIALMGLYVVAVGRLAQRSNKVLSILQGIFALAVIVLVGWGIMDLYNAKTVAEAEFELHKSSYGYRSEEAMETFRSMMTGAFVVQGCFFAAGILALIDWFISRKETILSMVVTLLFAGLIVSMLLLPIVAGIAGAPEGLTTFIFIIVWLLLCLPVLFAVSLGYFVSHSVGRRPQPALSPAPSQPTVQQ